MRVRAAAGAAAGAGAALQRERKDLNELKFFSKLEFVVILNF